MSNVIPLNVVDRALSQQGGEPMRDAVVQVINDLFVERVPEKQRLPLYDAAKDLVVKAGRTPEELLDAAEPGREQEALFDELGLAPEAED
jgi:hypothetical protein